MIYFTADTHAWHTNIIGHCNRPFETGAQMTEKMAENINCVVNKDDTLYHLGDFSWGNSLWIEGFRSMINCQNVHLICGNHDRIIKKKERLQKLFSSFNFLFETEFLNTPFTLCHYPLLSWNKINYGAIHLHGHCHGNLQEKHNRRIDVGVDCWNYKPISIEEIIKYVKEDS